MPELSKDLVALLQYLLPGFLVAWVFYGLTSHQKPSQFERVIQALIFSVGVQIVVIFERWLFTLIGSWRSFGRWNSTSELVSSFVIALLLGVIVAHLSNKDVIHKLFRRLNLSSRSAHNSEWYMALATRPRYIVIHFKDERRLCGWPTMWSSDPEKGYFLIDQPNWLDVEHLSDNLPECILISVNDVKWIEFLKPPQLEK